MDPIAAQIRQVWQGLMAHMTAQGATRQEIALLALVTAQAIVELTVESLWPEGQNTPDGELLMATAYTRVMEALEEGVREVQAQG